jgi:hypothetical protein
MLICCKLTILIPIRCNLTLAEVNFVTQTVGRLAVVEVCQCVELYKTILNHLCVKCKQNRLMVTSLF